MLTNFDTIKFSTEKAITDIESACRLKKAGTNMVWLSDDYCLDVDAFIKIRLDDLKTIVEYVEKNI